MTRRGPIHTLNARGNVMLEVMRSYFDLKPHHVQREIQGMRNMLEDTLARKGIAYAELRSALVPDRKRREVALVFDTTSIESGWYGYDVFERVIPLLDKRSNHSILVGDYLDRPRQADQLFIAFQEAVRLRRSVDYRHPTQFYIVYLNNQTEAMVNRLDEGLADYKAYVGYAETTYNSTFKIYLSTMLVNLCVKHGRNIIQGHEPDRDEAEDVNICGYPFEKSGFTCRSVSSDLEGVLLSYKIERPVFPGFEEDTEFALNAISLLPLPLDDFEVEVAEAKLAYIKANKVGSAERIGMETMSAADLAALIKEKISDSYIYSMEFLEDHGVAKFNVILEIPSTSSAYPTRLLASLEYRPEQKLLRLITLF